MVSYNIHYIVYLKYTHLYHIGENHLNSNFIVLHISDYVDVNNNRIPKLFDIVSVALCVTVVCCLCFLPLIPL